MESKESMELQKIRENPEDTALVIEIMAGSLAQAVLKGLQHGEEFQAIITKFVSRNL